MTIIKRHPAPEKLLRQITAETVNALALGEQPGSQMASQLENGAALIAKAWGLPQDELQHSLSLIRDEEQAVRSGGEAVPPNGELFEPYDGAMTVELLWGLFETTVRLEDASDRSTIHELALLVAECLDLDSWIETMPAVGV